ncbi:MAG: hypothetical protein R6U68_03595 [Desulfobacteraceae bacterium]
MVTESASCPGCKTAVTIVSGLPRSGTSLVMNMLQNGGLSVACDQHRKPDIDNPQGYFELEKVKKIYEDASFIARYRGMAVKVVSPLLKYLPMDETYKIVFVQRRLKEVMISQKKMEQRICGKKCADLDDDVLERAFQNHLSDVNKWFSEVNVSVLRIWYHNLVASPLENAQILAEYFDFPLDCQKMSAVVRTDLYRSHTTLQDNRKINL